MDKILTLADIHPRDRVAYWHDLACKAFVQHECRVTSSSALNATIDGVRLGELGLVNVESRGLECVERTAHNIAHGDDDVFLLCVQLHGSATIFQDGRQTVIYPGDFALLDAQRPYVCRYPHRKQITIKIPHRALKARLASSSQLTAHAVRHGDSVGGLASGYISMLPGRRRHQRALREHAPVAAGNLAAEAHHVASARPLPPRAGGSGSIPSHDHRDRVCLGLLGRLPLQSPLQVRVRVRAARLPPALSLTPRPRAAELSPVNVR
jgi:hypothetical protein